VATTVVAQVYRYRRVSGPVERQQTKWVVFGIVLGGAGLVGTMTLVSVVPAIERSELLAQMIGTTLTAGFPLLVPLSIGVAMVRSGLYEIDVIINRTLVYGTLTATLVVVYLGCVIGLQYMLRALTVEGSNLTIVASTLLIAALFAPLRRRIQIFIDRRFYRSKYDARKTLEAFSAKLRDETNLQALEEDLVGVVRETMQPAYVSLWLHPDTTSESERAR
jgi:Holliday junction resolvasome RuvABC ATP-dependent DNA helicase subunit